MNPNFSYTTTFVLDRGYYTECFEQSVVHQQSFRRYSKAIFFVVFGGGLVLFTEANPYAAWFVFALGVLEALALRYQKAWWVTRQMFSREAKSKVELVIDDTQIRTTSFYHKTAINWDDMSSMIATDKGWLLIHCKGKNYVSNQFLSDQAKQYLSEKLSEQQKSNTND
jgi:hypothetical protein